MVSVCCQTCIFSAKLIKKPLSANLYTIFYKNYALLSRVKAFGALSGMKQRKPSHFEHQPFIGKYGRIEDRPGFIEENRVVFVS